jgi:hypothetical protein
MSDEGITMGKMGKVTTAVVAGDAVGVEDMKVCPHGAGGPGERHRRVACDGAYGRGKVVVKRGIVQPTTQAAAVP